MRSSAPSAPPSTTGARSTPTSSPGAPQSCATTWSASRVECGDLIHAERTGQFDWARAIELHDLVAGNVDVPRAGNAPVLFETQGVALQDVAAAGLAWQRWLALGDTAH